MRRGGEYAGLPEADGAALKAIAGVGAMDRPRIVICVKNM